MGGSVPNCTTDGSKKALDEKEKWGNGVSTLIGVANSSPLTMHNAGSHNYSGSNFYDGSTAAKSIDARKEHGYLHHKPNGVAIGSGGSKVYKMMNEDISDIFLGFAWMVPYSGDSRCLVQIAETTSADCPFSITDLYNRCDSGS